jgi:DNA-binding NtrC family response regulator
MNSVLVVDDEAGIRTILTRWLTTAGYDVQSADSADTALAAMAAAPADVVMCDITMPGSNDGLWLAAELHKRYPASALILATGLDSVPPASSMQPGIVEYIVKPFNPDDVRRCVASAVRWHDAAVVRGPVAPVAADALDSWFAGTTKD